MPSSELLTILLNASRKLEQASNDINSLDDLPELALLRITEAEAQLKTIMELNLSGEPVEYVRKLVETALAGSEPLERRPLHAAKVALDSLILYRQSQIADRLPRWDIETFREVAQRARWRQDADSHISQTLGIINKAVKYLQSHPTSP